MIDNRELELLRAEQKAKEQGERFIALRWVLQASYHESEDEARSALAATTRTAAERVAIVDRTTGNSWTRPGLLRSVMRHLKQVEKTAPPRFRRVGGIGRISNLGRKRQQRRDATESAYRRKEPDKNLRMNDL